jgi:hypothetical protein
MQWRVVAVKSHERPSGSSRSRWCSRSRWGLLAEDVVVLEVVVLADRDVDVQKSPKNLIARLSRAGSLGVGNVYLCQRGVPESLRMCICARGRSPSRIARRWECVSVPERSTWKLENVYLCQRKESSYIGAEERRREWTCTLLTTIILIKRQLPVTAVFNDTPTARRASARVWHALLLLPTSQVVHHWSTLLS